MATALTQPVDVMKTRLQNAKPGEFSVSSIMECANNIVWICQTILFSSHWHSASGIRLRQVLLDSSR